MWFFKSKEERATEKAIEDARIFTEEVEQEKLINNLSNENLSKRAAKIDGINLKSNEFCYFSATEYFRWQEQKTRTVKTNYSGLKYSFRIAKGVHYKIGSTKHNSSRVTEWNVVFSGVPFLTNKRIIFVNDNGMKTISLSSIVGMKPFTDGTHLYRESGKVILLEATDTIEFNVILSRILNNDFDMH
ncbi:hypothetical protein [Candidatus Enterococcus ikei]|uniref:Uncharacterized protein n=1 Tax=Candidatus Enterococcus ikei TaxID=2815326 RepID=A0ABS3GXM6_9ENTE|nr:hypothetical protein [Enterococcus sp. DIV0869a]MBO0439580.1 hypothetical protein [Enterococcus sp. DIV0869a]